MYDTTAPTEVHHLVRQVALFREKMSPSFSTLLVGVVCCSKVLSFSLNKPSTLGLRSSTARHAEAEKLILNKYSRIITEPPSQGASQAMLYATGLTPETIALPQVGICSVWFEGNPCNMHLMDLSADVKTGTNRCPTGPYQSMFSDLNDSIKIPPSIARSQGSWINWIPFQYDRCQ